jgi:hypothetical protein
MQKIHVRIALSLLAAAFCLAPNLVLAGETPPPLAETWTMIPKSGQAQELTQALKNHIAFRSEHGDPWQWVAYTPFLGDNLDRVVVRSCCHSWADLDAYQDWGRSHPEVWADFSEHVAPLTEKYEHNLSNIDWANSHWNDKGGPYKYFAVTEFSVKPGESGNLHAALEKMSQIAIDQGWATDAHSWIWSSAVGGSPSVSIVIPHENFASMAGDGESFADFLARQMGSAEAAADLMKQFSSATLKSDYQIWVKED